MSSDKSDKRHAQRDYSKVHIRRMTGCVSIPPIRHVNTDTHMHRHKHTYTTKISVITVVTHIECTYGWAGRGNNGTREGTNSNEHINHLGEEYIKRG